jgi:hypothetical protein
MPILLKIRTDGDYSHFKSMVDEDYQVGEVFTWGTVGRDKDYRSAGDVKFFREGGLQVGERVILRERRSASQTFFVGVLKVARIDTTEFLGQISSYTPVYELVERFDGSANLDRLRATDPALASLPHFQKNAKGYMLRSFTPLTEDEFDVVVKAVRRSMKLARR